MTSTASTFGAFRLCLQKPEHRDSEQRLCEASQREVEVKGKQQPIWALFAWETKPTWYVDSDYLRAGHFSWAAFRDHMDFLRANPARFLALLFEHHPAELSLSLEPEIMRFYDGTAPAPEPLPQVPNARLSMSLFTDPLLACTLEQPSLHPIWLAHPVWQAIEYSVILENCGHDAVAGLLDESRNKFSPSEWVERLRVYLSLPDLVAHVKKHVPETTYNLVVKIIAGAATH